jgi:DNA-binding CsgD family transcriptional regulator
MTRVNLTFDDWLDVVLHLLHRPVTNEMPRAELLEALGETFGGRASWNELHCDGTLVLEVLDLPTNWPGRSEHEWWHRDGAEVHPLIRWYAASGSTAAMTMSRVPAKLFSADGRRAIRERLEPIGIDQQLCIPVWAGPTVSWAFVMARSEEAFSDEDLDLARAIQPLLALIAKRVQVPLAAPLDGLDLTGRERAVLGLLCEGWTAEAIARRLGTSPRTVHQHLQNIYRKLGVNDRMAAYRVALRHGLTPPATTDGDAGRRPDTLRR